MKPSGVTPSTLCGTVLQGPDCFMHWQVAAVCQQGREWAAD